MFSAEKSIESRIVYRKIRDPDIALSPCHSQASLQHPSSLIRTSPHTHKYTSTLKINAKTAVWLILFPHLSSCAYICTCTGGEAVPARAADKKRGLGRPADGSPRARVPHVAEALSPRRHEAQVPGDDLVGVHAEQRATRRRRRGLPQAANGEPRDPRPEPHAHRGARQR